MEETLIVHRDADVWFYLRLRGGRFYLVTRSNDGHRYVDEYPTAQAVREAAFAYATP